MGCHDVIRECNAVSESNPINSQHSTLRAYLFAICAALVVGLCAGVYFGAFRHEAHPDPVHGSLGSLLALVVGLVAFVAFATALLSMRWFLWPAARTWYLSLQAAGFASVFAMCLFMALAPVVLGLFVPRDEWVVVEGWPIPEGIEPAYFPRTFLRLERTDEKSQQTRYVEFALEGKTIHRRQGDAGSPASSSFGVVSLRTFKSVEKADETLTKLIAEAERSGYRRVAKQ